MTLAHVTDPQTLIYTLVESEDQMRMTWGCVSPVAQGLAGVEPVGSPDCGSFVLVSDAQPEALTAVKNRDMNISTGSEKPFCWTLRVLRVHQVHLGTRVLPHVCVL